VNVPGIDEDEPPVVQLASYRRPSRAQRLRYALPDVEVTPTTLLAAAFLALIFVVAPIRLLGATSPEFRGLVLTTVGWAVGLVAVGLVARVLSRLVPWGREHREKENDEL